MRRLLPLVVLLAGCSAAPAVVPSQPTPQIIFVTPAPTIPPSSVAPASAPAIESIAPLITPAPQATPDLTPAPTPLLTPGPTPAPIITPAPTAPPPTTEPTPVSTPEPTAVAQQVGEIWFGTGQKGGSLTGHRTAFKKGQGITFGAYFTEAAGATKVTGSLFKGPNDAPVFAEPLTVGVDWEGMFGTMTGRAAGRYHFQISRGGTLLAEGRFTVK
jgi:hypothetical protein